MSNPCFISSYVVLKDHRIIRDGAVVFEDKTTTGAAFLDRAYETLGMSYPKFHKMDHLCKTGFIAGEVLLQNRDWKEGRQAEELGVILQNAHSSLDTDLRYEESIAASPSPSLFVYTLPNVLIGELCIRHQLKGESACFVFDIFDAPFQARYVNGLFEAGKLKACISGWADFYDDKAEAFFYLAEETKRPGAMAHEAATLEKLFTNE